MLALIAWQDWMAMDEHLRRKDACAERVNIPSNRGHVWNYRMHMTIEALQQEHIFNEALTRLIADAGRAL
jgi:4-alpha-glucanotransferase